MIILALSFILCLSALSQVAGDTQGFYINNSQSVLVNPAPSGVSCNNCKNITDTSSKNVFVPTGSCSEWSTFLSNLPSGVTAGACCSAVTWYLDADGDGYYPPGGITSSCSSPGAGWTTSVKSAGDCDDSNAAIHSGTTRTMYQSTAVACGTACSSETQTCQANGTWSGSFAQTSCTASTQTMYQSSSVACGSSCTSETQTCQLSGSWTGTYAYASCTIAGASTWYLDADGDGYYPSGGTTSACSSPGAGWTTTPKSPGDCNDNNAGIIPGSTRTMYQSSSVPCGNSCTSETQTCQVSGSWSGSYQYSSCSVGACCTPNDHQACSGGALYWYDSCNNQGSQVSACTGSFCNSGNVWSYNGCSGSSCTSSQTQSCSGSYCSGNDLYNYNGCSGGACTSAFSQTCDSGTWSCVGQASYKTTGCSGGACQNTYQTTCPGSYCSGNYVYWSGCATSSQYAPCGPITNTATCTVGNFCSGTQRYSGSGCSGGACQNTLLEDCANNGNICWTDGNIYNGPWTCSPNQCNYASVTTCSGTYCSGAQVHTRSACSGSSCGDSLTQTCTSGIQCSGANIVDYGTGCSGGACTSGTVTQSCPSGIQCSGANVVDYGAGCSGGSCTSGTVKQSCTSGLQCNGDAVYDYGAGCSGGSCTSPTLYEDCATSCQTCQGSYCSAGSCVCTGVCL